MKSIHHYLQERKKSDWEEKKLIVCGSGSGKTNALLNLLNAQEDIDKIYLYTKDPYEPKYQYLINKREKVGLDHFKDLKAFMEYSNDMQDVYKNIEDYNPNKKRKVLIVFNDTIADMINNKRLNPIVTELFIRGKNLVFLLHLSFNHTSKCQKMLIKFYKLFYYENS